MINNFNMRLKMTQDSIIKEYLKNDKPWFLAYSGGKDSTAVLMLTYEAIKSIKHHNKIITIIYCDTGVEIPCVSTYTKKCLKNFQAEIEKDNLPFKIVIEQKLWKNIKLKMPILNKKIIQSL